MFKWSTFLNTSAENVLSQMFLGLFALILVQRHTRKVAQGYWSKFQSFLTWMKMVPASWTWEVGVFQKRWWLTENMWVIYCLWEPHSELNMKANIELQESYYFILKKNKRFIKKIIVRSVNHLSSYTENDPLSISHR